MALRGDESQRGHRPLWLSRGMLFVHRLSTVILDPTRSPCIQIDRDNHPLSLSHTSTARPALSSPRARALRRIFKDSDPPHHVRHSGLQRFAYFTSDREFLNRVVTSACHTCVALMEERPIAHPVIRLSEGDFMTDTSVARPPLTIAVLSSHGSVWCGVQKILESCATVPMVVHLHP